MPGLTITPPHGTFIRMTYRPKHIVEYLLLRGAAAVLVALPYRAALAFGWLVAGIGFHVARFRRREAERRIREVFGDRFNKAEVRRIAWQSFRNLIFTAVDTIRGPHLTLERFEKVGDYTQPVETLRRQLQTGRGAVLATPHMGCWEFGGVGMSLVGLPLFVIAGKQRNPLFDKFLTSTRERMGVQVVMRGSSTLRTIIVRLKQGQLTAVLPDVRMPTPGVKVRFLGKEANVGPGLALFARHAGVPVLPSLNYRHGWGRHQGVVYPPINADLQADKDADVQRMMQAVFDVFTEAISRDPGQWFWYNKRWVFDPV